MIKGCKWVDHIKEYKKEKEQEKDCKKGGDSNE